MFQLTVSSPSPLETPGRAFTFLEILPPIALLVVTSNFGPLANALNSYGLNCSRMPWSATVLWTLFSSLVPLCAFSFFCFLDFCGPTMPSSRRDAFSLFSCEGGILGGEVCLRDSKTNKKVEIQKIIFFYRGRCS